MPVKIGFTGTRNGMGDQRRLCLAQVLFGEYQRDAEFHHGCCIGSDVEAARLAHDIGYHVVAHPPLKTDNTAPFADWYADEIRESKSYFARNRDIVDETDKLIATPPTAEHQATGGTWYTIDYAKKRGKWRIIIEPMVDVIGLIR